MKPEYEKAATKFYAAVGRIAVLAEHGTEWLRHLAMVQSGLFFQNESQGAFRALTRSITAGNWPDTIEALTSRTMEGRDEDREVVLHLLARWRQCIVDRNRAVHTQWMVGWGAGGEGPSEEVSGVAWPIRGKKVGPKDQSAITLEELREIGDRMKAVVDALATLSMASHLPDGLARQFEDDGSGNLVPKGKISANPP